MTASMSPGVKRWESRGVRASARALAGGSLALLVACGGGGEGVSPPGPSRQALSAAAVTPSAAPSAAPVDALAPQVSDDRGEPQSVEGLLPATSETAEPRAVVR